MDDVMLFRHMVVDNRAERTLFLLHGTGGNEQDFLFLNEILGASYNLIGLQGNVNENGMPRFFKRISIGVFDEESIRVESNKLQRFVLSWMKTQKTIFEHLYFLGYSNGANILLASLFYYPHLFKNLLLLHPMLPLLLKADPLIYPATEFSLAWELTIRWFPAFYKKKLLKRFSLVAQV